jgi:hypothetical protein
MLFRFFLWLANIDWTKYRPAICLPNHCFCEAIGNGFIRQPIDAYSNIAYLMAGFGIIGYLLLSNPYEEKTSAQTHLPRNLFLLFGLASIAVGIGSFLYHAGFTFMGMELDDDTMYLIGSFMLFFGLAHLQPFSLKKFLVWFLLLNLSLETLIYFYPVVRGLIFGLLILAAIYSYWIAVQRGRMINQVRFLSWSLGIFAVAYFVWALDDLRLVCYPNSIFQGHSLWHILTSVAIFITFLYMDSEYRKYEK